LKRILLTGFRPFGEHKLNPTELLMQSIDERVSRWPALTIETLVVETAYNACQSQIKEALAQFRPDILLSFGLNYGSDTVRIERLGINIDHARAIDNAGESRSDRRIASEGPPAYWATLPAELLSAPLDAAGIPWRTSYYAGGYICNHLLYVALHFAVKRNLSTLCGFIHVPPLSEQVVEIEGRKGLELTRLIQATSAILDGFGNEAGAEHA